MIRTTACPLIDKSLSKGCSDKPFEIFQLRRLCMAYCSNCGKQLQDGNNTCPHCNFQNSIFSMQQPQQVPLQPIYYSQQALPTHQIFYHQQTANANLKSSGLTVVLAFLWPGVDNCYLDDVGMGIAKIIGYLILIITLIGIPIALVIWIVGMATASQRTLDYNNKLMARSQRMMQHIQQGYQQQPPLN